MKPSPLLVLPLLVACSNAPQLTATLSPYRVDVRQGNFVTQEMVAQLKPGQTRDQVRFILGSPLVTDIFHADRWDYVYRFKPFRGEVQERRLAVFFEKNQLVRVAGDVVAQDGAAGAEGSRAVPRVIDIAPAATEPAKPAEPALEEGKAGQ